MKIVFLKAIPIACLLSLLIANPALAMMKTGDSMNSKGMIMNTNHDNLPRDCKKLAGDVDITIRAGHKYARQFNGKMFAFDRQEWDVPPCTRINITFINDDHIRHQLMIHGLPGYLHPDGMIHFELYGPGELKGSLIVPGRKKTYLVHCELPQHMEKGMKAQLKVGGGDGDLSSIPGLTEPVTADAYPVDWNRLAWLILAFALLIGGVIPFFLLQRLLK